MHPVSTVICVLCSRCTLGVIKLGTLPNWAAVAKSAFVNLICFLLLTCVCVYWLYEVFGLSQDGFLTTPHPRIIPYNSNQKTPSNRQYKLHCILNLSLP